jgi:Velvet factor
MKTISVFDATSLTTCRNFLSSPYYFMCVTLHDSSTAEICAESRNSDVAGTLVSSLHRVKDTESNGECQKEDEAVGSDIATDVGYFVFQDLSIRKEGEFRLKFNLFELQRCDLTCPYPRPIC